MINVKRGINALYARKHFCKKYCNDDPKKYFSVKSNENLMSFKYDFASKKSFVVYNLNSDNLTKSVFELNDIDEDISFCQDRIFISSFCKDTQTLNVKIFQASNNGFKDMGEKKIKLQNSPEDLSCEKACFSNGKIYLHFDGKDAVFIISKDIMKFKASDTFSMLEGSLMGRNIRKFTHFGSDLGNFRMQELNGTDFLVYSHMDSTLIGPFSSGGPFFSPYTCRIIDKTSDEIGSISDNDYHPIVYHSFFKINEKTFGMKASKGIYIYSFSSYKTFSLGKKIDLSEIIVGQDFVENYHLFSFDNKIVTAPFDDSKSIHLFDLNGKLIEKYDDRNLFLSKYGGEFNFLLKFDVDIKERQDFVKNELKEDQNNFNGKKDSVDLDLKGNNQNIKMYKSLLYGKSKKR